MREKVQAALARLDDRDFEAFKHELRVLERMHGDDLAESDMHEFLRSDPGYPLGRGFPPGRVVRLGSHRGAWMEVVRGDPCSYCGDAGGTVDHIEPRSRGGRDVWVNYTGSCESCNGSKSNTRLLAWLAHRRVLVEG
jgi:hypothetical protein